MYLGETYRRYIEKNDLDLYTTKKVELPKPELYVVYTVFCILGLIRWRRLCTPAGTPS